MLQKLKKYYFAIINTLDKRKLILGKKSYFKKYKNSSIIFHPNATLKMGVTPPKHIAFPTILKLGRKANLIVKGKFEMFTGSKIAVLDNAKLELGSGYINLNVQIICYMHIKIGENVAIADGTVIRDSDSHTVIQDSIEKIKTLPIDIGNHVWIGQNCIILKGVKIGENSIIGAGSVVTKDIPANSLAVGNPARIVKNNITWKN